MLEDSHRDDALRMEPFVWELPSVPNEPASMIGPALRRFREKCAPPLEENVRARQGPYFASGNWWDEKRWARAEWDLELENGTVCRCREEPNELKLEAIYD